MFQHQENNNRGRCIRWAAVLAAFCFLLTAFPAFAEDAAGSENTDPQNNLLDNPDWENGTDGWEIVSGLEEMLADGKPAQRTDVYQELFLDGYPEGQVLAFSARIGLTSEDPAQELIRMSLSFYAADGNLLDYVSETEDQEGLFPHTVQAAIPAGAATARVTLSLLKRSVLNIINFADLSLVIAAQADGNILLYDPAVLPELCRKPFLAFGILRRDDDT